VVTTSHFQKTMKAVYGQNWEGSLTFEKVKRYLPYFKSAIQVPIYVIGSTFSSGHAHPAPARARSCTGTLSAQRLASPPFNSIRFCNRAMWGSLLPSRKSTAWRSAPLAYGTR